MEVLISGQAIVSIYREGAGVTLSRLDLNRPKLAAALEKLVADNGYRDAMRRLKQLQDPIDGAARAARETVRFLSSGQPC